MNNTLLPVSVLVVVVCEPPMRSVISWLRGSRWSCRAAGLSQQRLGETVNYTGALIGMIETAKRMPSRDFAERCDEVLGTEGALSDCGRL